MASPTKSKPRKATRVFDNECLKASLAIAQYVVASYSKFISQNSLGEHFVCDECLLPHPKEVIKSSYKLWMSFIAKDEDMDRCQIQFPILAQFQEDIGAKPIKLFTEPSASSKERETEDKTLLLEKKPSSKLITDIGLIKKIFNERAEIERLIHNHTNKDGQ